ncbi:MAG: sulfite exporter TauE/SafE family protein [Pseudomonadota bacterium]
MFGEYAPLPFVPAPGIRRDRSRGTRPSAPAGARGLDILTVLMIGAAAFLVSGTIKGVAGIGLPTAAIAFMTLFLDPRTAIALVLFPMTGSNMRQLILGGHFLRTARRYRVFAIILFFGVFATTYGTQNTSDRALLAVLGVVVLIFVFISWKNIIQPLPDRFDRAAQVGFGLVSGVIGGMTAAWAPPVAMYLATKQVDKDEFIRATGFLISVGSIPLVLSYAQIGFLTKPLAGLSLAMLIPTFLGMKVGEVLRRRLSVETFRRVILIVFAFLGFNLIRRAIWYG